MNNANIHPMVVHPIAKFRTNNESLALLFSSKAIPVGKKYIVKQNTIAIKIFMGAVYSFRSPCRLPPCDY